jgi:SAM-dependent methyltransferase
MSSDLIHDIPFLHGPVPLSHLILRHYLREGDLGVDATCGNGHDTLLLAELVGSAGRVWAFDIQEQAINQTARRLADAGLAERVELLLGGHETLAEHVSGELGAVVFNLGYLPGGDQAIITRPETTLAAFGQALGLLRPGGILAVSVYPGHDGGASERRTVDAWAAGLAPQSFHAWRMGQLNVPYNSPYFILIQKTA